MLLANKMLTENLMEMELLWNWNSHYENFKQIFLLKENTKKKVREIF